MGQIIGYQQIQLKQDIHSRAHKLNIANHSLKTEFEQKIRTIALSKKLNNTMQYFPQLPQAKFDFIIEVKWWPSLDSVESEVVSVVVPVVKAIPTKL